MAASAEELARRVCESWRDYFHFDPKLWETQEA